jgi:hypothetical protein
MLRKHRFASVNYPTFANHISYDGGVLQYFFVAHYDSPTLKDWWAVCVNCWREYKLDRRICGKRRDMSPKFFGCFGSESD